jgi:hypothetical protein
MGFTDGTVHEDKRLQTTSLTAQATYVWCNTEAHLHSHCYCGKVISITHYECVYVALLSSMQNTCTILFCHLWPVWLYHIFPHLTNSPNIKFHENMSSGSWVVCANQWTQRHNEANSRSSRFCQMCLLKTAQTISAASCLLAVSSFEIQVSVSLYHWNFLFTQRCYSSIWFSWSMSDTYSMSFSGLSCHFIGWHK